MKRSLKASLLAVIVLAVSLPAGFAIAQVVDRSESDEPLPTHVDPDLSTDAVELNNAAIEAREAGDQAAYDKAIEAMHDEWLSRLSPEERQAAEASLPEPDVPDGTYAYVNETVTYDQVKGCRRLLEERGSEILCELIVLYDEDKIRSGAFTLEQATAAIEEGSR